MNKNYFWRSHDSVVSVSSGENQGKNTKMVAALCGAAHVLMISTVDDGNSTVVLISP